MTAVESFSDDKRRGGIRRRTFKGGKVAFGDFRFTWDCVVRNVSESGALIRSDHASDIPADFYLFDPAEHTVQRAEVVWRTARDIGVRFREEPIHVHATDDRRLARFRFV